MEGFAVIVTHHKTGTVWMRATFRRIAERLDIPFVRVHSDDIVPAEELIAPMIFFEGGGEFQAYPDLCGDPRVKIVHLIRDPRDVMISGMHYHRTSREEWLRKPSQRFGGRTYQSEINSFATDRARYVFEMDNRAASTIQAMLRWYDGERSNAFECKYEDLMQDVKMVLFTKAATHLGFSGKGLRVCRSAFWKSSLFGRNTGRKTHRRHIRSGEAKQWTKVFDKHLAVEFGRRFGDALVRLGYESDGSWIDGLPAISPALDVSQ